MKQIATTILGYLMVAGAIIYATAFVIPMTFSAWWLLLFAFGGVLGIYLNTTR